MKPTPCNHCGRMVEPFDVASLAEFRIDGDDKNRRLVGTGRVWCSTECRDAQLGLNPPNVLNVDRAGL